MNTNDAIDLYFEEKRRIIDNFPRAELARVVEMLFDVYDSGGTVYIMGNGGNAGTMDHLYCDFRHHPFVSEDKGRPLPGGMKRLNMVNLCGSAAELTGLVNDLGVEHMYSGALAPWVTADDLVMGYSGSGNSANVVNALEVAKDKGAKTFAMAKGSGGRCLTVADVCIVVPGTSNFPGQTGPNDNNFHFEDAILAVNHIMLGLLKARVAEGL
ncbi:MAG: SIS domain-containing protein [Sedimenticola sp.]